MFTCNNFNKPSDSGYDTILVTIEIFYLQYFTCNILDILGKKSNLHATYTTYTPISIRNTRAFGAPAVGNEIERDGTSPAEKSSPDQKSVSTGTVGLRTGTACCLALALTTATIDKCK